MDNNRMENVKEQELISLVKQALNSDVSKGEFKEYIEMKKKELKKHMN